MRLTYDPANNRPATVVGSSGQTYSILYDGFVPTFIKASGLVTSCCRG